MSSPELILSVTPLGISATFTGNWVAPLGYDAGNNYVWAVALSSSDKTGTLIIDQGEYNPFTQTYTVLRSDSLATAVDASSNQSALLKVAIVCNYIRVRYTNGATAQTFFFSSLRYSLD